MIYSPWTYLRIYIQPFLPSKSTFHLSYKSLIRFFLFRTAENDHLYHINRFLRAWVVEMQTQKHSYVLSSISDELFKSCLKEMQNNKEKTAFCELYHVFQHTAFPWQENLPISYTMAAHVILESSLKLIWSTILQIDMNWEIHTQFADYILSGYILFKT